MFPHIFLAERVITWVARGGHSLKWSVVNARREHVVSVGVWGVSGSEADINFECSWISFISVALGEEGVVSKLWCTREHEHSVQCHTNNLVRVSESEQGLFVCKLPITLYGSGHWRSRVGIYESSLGVLNGRVDVLILGPVPIAQLRINVSLLVQRSLGEVS